MFIASAYCRLTQYLPNDYRMTGVIQNDTKSQLAILESRVDVFMHGLVRTDG